MTEASFPPGLEEAGLTEASFLPGGSTIFGSGSCTGELLDGDLFKVVCFEEGNLNLCKDTTGFKPELGDFVEEGACTTFIGRLATCVVTDLDGTLVWSTGESLWADLPGL